MPSHWTGKRRSRRKSAASKAVTAGVVEAIRVALPTMEYCRPVNWATLFTATPVTPMQNNGKRHVGGGNSGVVCRQRMIRKSVPLIRKKRATVRLTGVISRTTSLMKSG